MRFLTNEPALLIERPERILVVSDLHLGIEYEFYQAGIKVPSQMKKMAQKIKNLLKATLAKKLIILGDVKHKVPGLTWQELREIPDFLEAMNSVTTVNIVPGNHDSMLKQVTPPEIEIYSNRGFRLGDFFFSHGHTWPSDDFLKAKCVITGHNHPQIRFKDRLGYVWMEPVWVKTKLKKEALKKRYGKIKRSPKIIIMPAFNGFAGGMAVNRKKSNRNFIGPLVKCADMKKAKIYMLDGTYLGELSKL